MSSDPTIGSIPPRISIRVKDLTYLKPQMMIDDRSIATPDDRETEVTQLIRCKIITFTATLLRKKVNIIK